MLPWGLLPVCPRVATGCQAAITVTSSLPTNPPRARSVQRQWDHHTYRCTHKRHTHTHTRASSNFQRKWTLLHVHTNMHFGNSGGLIAELSPAAARRSNGIWTYYPTGNRLRLRDTRRTRTYSQNELCSCCCEDAALVQQLQPLSQLQPQPQNWRVAFGI